MQRRTIPGHAFIDQTHPFHERSKLLERYTAVDLSHRSLYNVLQLRGIEDPRATQRQQMTPCFRGKTPALMRTKYTKGHTLYTPHGTELR